MFETEAKASLPLPSSGPSDPGLGALSRPMGVLPALVPAPSSFVRRSLEGEHAEILALRTWTRMIATDAQGGALAREKEMHLESVRISLQMTGEIASKGGAVWGLLIRGRSASHRRNEPTPSAASPACAAA